MTFDQINDRYNLNSEALAAKLAAGPLTADTDLAWSTHSGVWNALAIHLVCGGDEWLTEAADRIDRAERLTNAL